MSAPSPRRLDSFSHEFPPQSPYPQSPSIRSQFPFPQYDSARRRSRRGSNSSIASIATSIGGALDTSAQNNLTQINELAQNAISTLLSSPIVRTGLIPQSALASSVGHRAPTVRDIPPVTLTPVPHVECSAFTSYLSRIGPLFERYQSTKAEESEATSPTKERLGYDRRFSTLSDPPATPVSPLSPSLSRQGSYFGTPASPDIRRRSSARPKRDPHAPTPLTTIPSVYLEENFQLENPRTFDVVSEKSDVIPQPPPGAGAVSYTHLTLPTKRIV